MKRRTGFLSIVIILVIILAGCNQQGGYILSKQSVKQTAPGEKARVQGEDKGSLQYPVEVVAMLQKINRVKGGISVKNAEDYGRIWGSILKQQAESEQKTAIESEADPLFISFLLGEDGNTENKFDFFNLPKELKKSFQLGFRQGYEDRNGDLVLSLNLLEAVRRMAAKGAAQLMKIYQEKIIADIVFTNRFKKQWRESMHEVLETLEGLTAEGSPAETAAFLSAFPLEYEKELSNLIKCLNGYMRCDLKVGGELMKSFSSDDIYGMIREEDELRFTESSKNILGTNMGYAVMNYRINESEDGVNTYYKYSRKKKANQEALLPLTDSHVENSVLHGEGLGEQLNKISWLYIGEEMGRKYKNSLVTMDEMLEWLRKSRSIMESQSVEGFYDTSIRLLREGFQIGYGPGDDKEWKRLADEINLSY